jgi:hypothetical protein
MMTPSYLQKGILGWLGSVRNESAEGQGRPKLESLEHLKMGAGKSDEDQDEGRRGFGRGIGLKLSRWLILREG